MIKAEREAVLAALEAVSPGLSPKGVIEQSECFIFRKGKVFAYNDEEFCQAPLPLNGIEGAVPAKRLVGLLQGLKEDELGFEQSNGELRIRGKGRTAGITMNAEVLLPIDQVERPAKDAWVKVGERYGEAMMMAQECAGRDAKDFATAIVHFHPKWIEAFDNYQMLRYTINTKLDKPTVVKSKGVKVAAGIGVSAVALTESWMWFKNERGLVVGCRRFVHDFFDLGANVVIDGEKVSLPKGLVAACEIAEGFSAEDADNNVVTVEMKPGKLRVMSRGVSGWYEERKEIKYDGRGMRFIISPKILREIVAKHNDVFLSETRLKVDGGKWVYCTVIGSPENKD